MIPWLNNYYYPEDRNNDAYLRTSQSNFFGPVNDLLVYPNPVISNTRIVLNTLPASDVHVDIIDMNGNLVRSYKYIPGTYNLDVDMSRLPLGLYSVRVYGKDIDFHNLKVVKQGF